MEYRFGIQIQKYLSCPWYRVFLAFCYCLWNKEMLIHLLDGTNINIFHLICKIHDLFGMEGKCQLTLGPWTSSCKDLRALMCRPSFTLTKIVVNTATIGAIWTVCFCSLNRCIPSSHQTFTIAPTIQMISVSWNEALNAISRVWEKNIFIRTILYRYQYFPTCKCWRRCCSGCRCSHYV